MDANQILEKIKEEEQSNEGKLKIFLGYAAGSGKTYTMLEAAHDAKKHGVDVVLGYIEPHDRKDTISLTKGIESIPIKKVSYKGIYLNEFDLDAALKRKPQLILVDELAHTNAFGCRNEKRYQDIEELLRAGIDVYTTMNIQHLESLNDYVATITNVTVKERVPDFIFEKANQVELVDIEPEDLIKRMKEGKIYHPKQALQALNHFFRKDKLVALREVVLRAQADRVNRIATKQRSIHDKLDYPIGEHILVCVSGAPSSQKVIRQAARLADAFHAKFTGLCIMTPEIKENQIALQKNIELAKNLGANVVCMEGNDIATQIVQYARLGNVSKIVLGRTNHYHNPFKKRSELLEKLTYLLPNVDIYIIPDIKRTKKYIPKRKKQNDPHIQDFVLITGVMLAMSVIAYLFSQLQFSEANVIMMYLVGVLISSYLVNQKIAAFYSAFISVILFNYFFTEPVFSLKAYDPSYPFTFVVLFIVGLFIGSLTAKLKRQNTKTAKIAYRTQILLENSQKLRRCKSPKDIYKNIANQSLKLLNLSVLIYPIINKQLKEPLRFCRQDGNEDLLNDINELGVVQWVVANHHRAGALTHTLPNALCQYLPIYDGKKVYGVVGVYLEERRPINPLELDILNAILNETAVKLQEFEDIK